MRKHSILALALLCFIPTAFAQGDETTPAPPPDELAVQEAETEELRTLVEKLEGEAALLGERMERAQTRADRAKARLRDLEEAYAGSETTTVPTTEEVIARIDELEATTSKQALQARLDDAQERADRYLRIRDDAMRQLFRLDEEMRVVDDDPRVAARKRRIRADREAVLRELRDTAQLRLDEARTLRGLTQQLDDTRRNTLYLLRRENLLLRSPSNLTAESIERGWSDAARLPEWLGQAASGVATYVGSDAERPALIRYVVAVIVAVAFFVFLLRRIRAIGERQPEEDAGWKGRLFRLLVATFRAAAIPLLLLLVFVGAAALLTDLPKGVEPWLRSVGYVAAIAWFVRGLARRLFRPGPPTGDVVIELEDAAKSRLRLGVGLLAWVSVIFVPAVLALENFGYGNSGVIELLWLVYKSIVGIVLVLVLLRGDLLTSLLPEESSGIGRLLHLLVGYLKPLAMLLVPTLIVLDALRFDILAELITRFAAGALAAIVVGGIANRFLEAGAVSWAESRLANGGQKETVRTAAYESTRFFVLLFTLGLTLWTFLTVSGSDLKELRGFLDAPLPLAGGGDQPITWWNLFACLVILFVFFGATKHAKASLQGLVLRRTRMDEGLQYTISTLFGYTLVGIGSYLALTQVFDLSNLGYVVAALSVGIGFGLQEIISNFVSGLILLVERPLKVGDLVRVDQIEGVVKQINIRATTVQTLDNVYLLVPNKEFIAVTVINFAHRDAKMRLRIDVGVSYRSDTGLVRRTLLEVADASDRIMANPKPTVRFMGFGDSSLNFELLVWIESPPLKDAVATEFRFAIFEAFREAGIEIPFPQRDLHIRSAETIRVINEEASAVEDVPDAEEPALADAPEPPAEPPVERVEDAVEDSEPIAVEAEQERERREEEERRREEEQKARDAEKAAEAADAASGGSESEDEA